jgi:hypothetical protein
VWLLDQRTVALRLAFARGAAAFLSQSDDEARSKLRAFRETEGEKYMRVAHTTTLYECELHSTFAAPTAQAQSHRRLVENPVCELVFSIRAVSLYDEQIMKQ